MGDCLVDLKQTGMDNAHKDIDIADLIHKSF